MLSFPPFPQRLSCWVSSIERHSVFYLRNNINFASDKLNILPPSQNNGERMRLTFYEEYEVWSEFSILLESTIRAIFSFLYEAHFGHHHNTLAYLGLYGQHVQYLLTSVKLTLFVPNRVVNTFTNKPMEQSGQKGLQRFPKTVLSVNANWRSTMNNGLPFMIDLFRRVFHAPLKSESPKKKRGSNF